MRHTLELLICATIGAFCVWRCYAVLPLALAAAVSAIMAYVAKVAVERGVVAGA